MIQLGVRFKGKCPQHPCYSPERDGRGAIRGGCPACYALWAVYDQVIQLRGRINSAEREIATAQQFKARIASRKET